MLLAAVGLYGVISYTVSQKTGELGMRIALGATTADVLRLVLSRGFALVALGVFIGGGITLGLTRLITTLLYQVSPYDRLAFAAALTMMLSVSLAALWMPAHRAASIDPAKAVRE
jgi:putative ABC transport system permease protein